MGSHFQIRVYGLNGVSMIIVHAETEIEPMLKTLKFQQSDIDRIEVWKRRNIFSPWREIEDLRWFRPRPKIIHRSRTQGIIGIISELAAERRSLYNRICDAIEDVGVRNGVEPQILKEMMDRVADSFKEL